MNVFLLEYMQHGVLTQESENEILKADIKRRFLEFIANVDRPVSVFSAETQDGVPAIKIYSFEEYLSVFGIDHFLFLDMDQYSNLAYWVILGVDDFRDTICNKIRALQENRTWLQRIYFKFFRSNPFWVKQPLWIESILVDDAMVITKESDGEGLLIYYQEAAALSGLRAIFKNYVFKQPFTKN